MTVDVGSLLAAAELVDDIGGQVARERAAFELAFRLGFGHGVDVGRAQAESEMDAAWSAAAARIKARALAGLASGQVSDREADARVRHAEAEARRMAVRHYDTFTARSRAAGKGAA